MLTYLQVLLYLIVPPIVGLGAFYRPLMGRREFMKFTWLILMATAYTTPWDNFIIARGGWTYPVGSILGTINCIPIEEHLFFILQPILIILLYCVYTHSTLLPFTIPDLPNHAKYEPSADGDNRQARRPTVQTLRRRPLAASLWALLFLAGLYLVNDAHRILPDLVSPGLSYGMKGFYLGWIMVWISPVVGFLTYLGGDLVGGGMHTFVLGSAWLCAVDTIAIRNGAWSVARETSLGLDLWKGLPFEECIFFILTTYLIIIATQLITHLQALMVLAPHIQPCPPANFAEHIAILARIAFDPPEIDLMTLRGLRHAEETLRKGSKSFDVAKLAFGREMRIGLVAIYAWCRMTDNMVDDPTSSATGHEKKIEYLAAIKGHLIKSYEENSSPAALDAILDLLDLEESDRAIFHAFSHLIPRLVPIHPFIELCHGYETDLHFSNQLVGKSALSTGELWKCLPIITNADLLSYADDVAGSVASACCHLAWSILSPSPNHPTRPVLEFAWAKPQVKQSDGDVVEAPQENDRIEILKNAREMGWALQLVNIARDMKKDALNNRVYIPLSSFPSSELVLAFLRPKSGKPLPSCQPQVLGLVDIAYSLRDKTAPYMELLPREARGGLRAMVASYFEIAEEIVRRKGEVEDAGIKVSSWRRARAASAAFWGLS